MYSDVSNKIAELRQLMEKHQLDYYYVPATDPHHNEYLPEHYQRRAWLTHFTGSAGDALMGINDAYLWTDPRYFLQAEQELDSKIFTLMRQMPGAISMLEWLTQNAENKRIGVDPQVITISQQQRWHTEFKNNGAELVSLTDNLVDKIWHDQPKLITHPIEILPLSYAGVNTAEKIKIVKTEIKNLSAQAHVISSLDAIAWLLNIRGQDIAFNPLAISYAIITEQNVQLFINPEQITSEARQYFKKQKIEVLAYTQFCSSLNTLTETTLLEPNSCSWWIQQQLNQAEIILSRSPITNLKAIKNKIEQAGMHEAHRRDAIAMVKFLCWLEHHWQGETELTAAEKLESFRRQDAHLKGLSFNTISGFGAHGAIIHYRVTPESNIPLDDNSLYLIDSGGQYLEGTTDITRTVHLGQPTPEEKLHYTLVLKGHLALRHTQFPFGTCGEHLSALAHQPLWQAGLDFGHGVGHGVGCYLCVHEGPQRISAAYTGVPLAAGMIVSNEPGVYFTDQYGIRIENCCLIKETQSAKKSATGHGPFLGFEDLTKVPYARHLIDLTQLSNLERQWINEYHHEIFSLLCNELESIEREWLLQATQPL